MESAEKLFERRARESPEAIALTLDARSISYGELDRASNRVARRLRREGIGSNSLVAVSLDRSFELIAAILGVLKSGAAYVPIDPEFPEERVRFVLSDSGGRALVSGPRAPGEALPASILRVELRDVFLDLAEEGDEALESGGSPEDLAYVIYTSGSTGKPKGVLVTRGNVSWFLSAFAATVDFGTSDVWALFHSCSFDGSVLEIFGALAFGGRLVVVPAGTARSPRSLAKLIDRESVTMLCQTPSAFSHLVSEPALSGKSLRYILVGGEALEPRRLAPWFDRFGDERPRVVNLYGPTEATIWATARRIRLDDAARSTSPLGKSLPGAEIRLVDKEGRPVAGDETGEIWIGGPGVAHCYLNRPELDAERFLFLDGSRFYRTGDLARRAPDGDLEFLGRADDQVKIRGYRVEPGEVAAVLRENPSIEDAVVVAAPSPDGAVLVGYVVPASGGGIDEGEIRRALRRRLPEYMVCSRILAIPAIPLNVSGKLDRKALPIPEARPTGAARFVAPRTPTEEAVASLFSEATGVARVGAEDDFFELGGHSLSAMRVAARLRELFRVATGPGLLFEFPTVDRLAAHLESRATSPAQEEEVALEVEPASRRDRLQLTFAQDRVLLFHGLHPGSAAYNFQVRILFRGELDSETLRRALSFTVERHEAYRSTFHVEGEERFQRVHPRGVVRLDEIDLTGLPPEEAENRAETLRRERAERPFDVSNLPLVEWLLIRLPRARHIVFHLEDHLVHDGWSFFVFLRDLIDCYTAFLEEREPSLPPVLQVGDFAAAHRRWIAGPGGDEQRHYWEQRLAGTRTTLDIPGDRPRPSFFSYRGDSIRFDVPPDLVAALRSLARREGMTFYMVLLAGFGVLLGRVSDTEDLCVGAGIAGRRWKETENTVGMLINNLVLRLRPRADASAREFFGDVRETVLGALENQDLPFEEMVRAAGAARSLRENPVAQAFFTAYEGLVPELRVPGAEIEVELPLSNGTAKFDWNVIVLSLPRPGQTNREAGDRVEIIWEYATDLFDRASIERRIRQYLACLGAFVEDASRPLADIPLVDAEERRFLLSAAAGADTPYPRDATIPEIFERTAAERPESIAVRDEREAVTYRDLDRRASSLTAVLLSHGVGAEDVVAFLLPRGVGAISTMLGILKCGAAYLPLSPGDPPRRLEKLLRGSGARLVVTTAELRDRIPESDAKVLLAENIAEGPAPPQPLRAGAAEGLAAVMFTSGSTGEPKGVEVLHRGIVRLLFGADYARFGPGEKILQLAALSFDASTFEIWGALLHGGELVIPGEELPSAGRIGETIRRHGITTMWLTATLFNAIVDERPESLEPLTQLLIGGEALSVPHVRKALRHLPRTRLINGYGPTENTTFSCCHPIPADLPAEASSIPIGRPISHSSAYILDSRGRLAPRGAVGEIHVGGDGLARGYRGNPEATSASFLDHPEFGRLYRTGDLGRLNGDGSIEFRGRRDSQLKIRGFRVEPGEVEAALVRVPGVARVSVVPVEDAAGSRSLIAFGVASPGAAPDPLAVLAEVSTELPSHAVPARLVFVDELPTTPHGKLDLARVGRRALEEAKGTHGTLLEALVAAGFAEVLGRAYVGPNEDFFTAGGHSLLAFRLLSRLERSLGVPVEPSLLFRATTPRTLAREIERLAGGPEPAGVAPASSLLVPVTRGERPLFFVPGGEGGDLSIGLYARLAFYLPNTAFWGVRVRESWNRGKKLRSVEEMAADCIREIRNIQPAGPYDLGGGCTGGIVAFEMARQMAAAGESVANLVLLDTAFPSLRGRIRQRLRSFSTRTRRRLLALSKRMAFLPEWRWRRLYVQISRRLPFDEIDADASVPEDWIRFVDTVIAYRPGAYPGSVTLFASEEIRRADSPRRWAAAIKGGLHEIPLPGNHNESVRDNVATVGEALRRILEGEQDSGAV